MLHFLNSNPKTTSPNHNTLITTPQPQTRQPQTRQPTTPQATLHFLSWLAIGVNVLLLFTSWDFRDSVVVPWLVATKPEERDLSV